MRCQNRTFANHLGFENVSKFQFLNLYAHQQLLTLSAL